MSVQQSFQYGESLPLVNRAPSAANSTQAPATQPVRRKPPPPSIASPMKLLRLQSSEPQSYSQLRAEDDHNHTTGPSVTGHVQSAAIWDDERHERTRLSYWMPYALRLPSLLALLLFDVALFITVIFLHIKSKNHSGLTTDDGSGLVLFEWRFAPTLVAVVYVFMWMVVVDNVNRTESFARMSETAGSIARASLLRTVGPWWSTLADSLPQRKDDRKISVVLFCTVLAYILGFLAISPLSSSLLSPRDILISRKETFFLPLLDSQTSLQPALGPVTFFRTIGNVLQNVTTSPWISNRYAVVPFSLDPDQYTFASVPQNNQIWRTSGLVFEADLECETMNVTGPRNVTYVRNYDVNGTVYGTTNFTAQTIQLSSDSGCEYGFAVVSENIYDSELSYWSNVSNTDVPMGWQSLVNLSDPLTVVTDPSILFNVTDACASEQVMISAILAQATGLQVEAKLCSSSYLVGNTTIEISTKDNVTSWSFDQQTYESSRHTIDDRMVNITKFQESFLSGTWTNHLQQLSLITSQANSPTSTLPYWGPATLIGALHEFNLSASMSDPNTELQARTIHQRAFGETILEAMNGVDTTSAASGQIITSERRIVVVEAVAYVIEVLLGIQMVLGTIVLLRTIRSNRSLGVTRDVAFTNTIASVVTSHAMTATAFERLYHENPSAISKVFGDVIAKTAAGKLELTSMTHEAERPQSPTLSAKGPLEKTNGPSITPFVLKSWLVGCLGSLLGLVLVVISTLYWYSLNHGLYQSFFTHRSVIDIGDMQLGTLAPYSIIPTFIAVVIGLWWGALEAYFRRMQPYISQAKGPTPAGKGSGLSYQSSYLLWAAFRALYRKNVLLALMCTGAFFTQILTIAMSALWQPLPSHVTTVKEVNQSLELRQIPHINYNVGSYKDIIQGPVLDQLFMNLRTNWMYSATIQLTLNGSEPTWSKDGWSFVPLDLGPLSSYNASNQSTDGSLDMTTSASNITIQTPAIRARLECNPWAEVEDPWWLVRTNDVTNSTIWKETTNSSQYSEGYIFQTSFPLLPGGGAPLCCAQGSMTEPGVSSLGYWVLDHEDPGWADKNFSTKWLTGTAQVFEYVNPDDTESRFTWLERPSVVAANCTPIIESANAEVRLNAATEAVYDYTILDEAKPDDNAWTDSFVMHEDPASNLTMVKNVTTSYGYLFLQAFLKAGSVTMMTDSCANYSYGCFEDLTDETFNIRQAGLNMDFPTYSMLTMANNSGLNFSDPEIWINLAQKTFATFFQHFASTNLTGNGDGGWVYQRINATMPNLDGGNATTTSKRSTASTTAMLQVSITVDRPVEILRMSAIAVSLSLCILAWLLVTTVLIMTVKKRYFSPILRKIDTIADLAMLVAGSEQYLALAKERGMEGLQDEKDFQTRLGWFRKENGEVRWGIELVNEHVEWLSEKEVAALAKPPEE